MKISENYLDMLEPALGVRDQRAAKERIKSLIIDGKLIGFHSCSIARHANELALWLNHPSKNTVLLAHFSIYHKWKFADRMELNKQHDMHFKDAMQFVDKGTVFRFKKSGLKQRWYND